jgi:hypothetical protein
MPRGTLRENHILSFFGSGFGDLGKLYNNTGLLARLSFLDNSTGLSRAMLAAVSAEISTVFMPVDLSNTWQVSICNLDDDINTECCA